MLIAERDAASGEATAEAIARDFGAAAAFAHTDVTDKPQVAAMVDGALTLGGVCRNGRRASRLPDAASEELR